MLDFQKLDPFWSLWSKPNPGISSKMLYPAQLNCNLERNIGHEIFVKTEKAEYLSNQLTYAHFDRKFIFPIKFGTSEQIIIFWISKMSQISGTATVKFFFSTGVTSDKIVITSVKILVIHLIAKIIHILNFLCYVNSMNKRHF